MNSHRIRHIIFDWNGTLLDDCDLAVATVNSLLADARRQPISREQYRRLFRFPIADLYRDLGFETAGSNFRQLMQNYLSRFNAAVDDCGLHDGVPGILRTLGTLGVSVSVLSASRVETLHSSIRAKRIEHFLFEAVGLDDDLAHGKIAVAQSFASRHALDPHECLLVGDTDHDLEVARAMGWAFAFIPHGHQDGTRIGSGVDALKHLEDVVGYCA